MFQTIFCCVMLFCLCLWYTFIHSACRTTARRCWDLQLWLISTASCRNTFKISIFWWWRASGREVGMQEGGGGRLRCTSSVYEAESKWLSKRVRGCLWVWERKRERETVVMIDARLPPLCSSEWLQQKAQNNIPDSLLCFFLSPCVSASRRGLRSQLCRGYAETEPASEAGSLAAINKLGLEDHRHERGMLDLELTIWADIIAVEGKQKGKKKKKKKGEEGGVCSPESLWMQLINLKKII